MIEPMAFFKIALLLAAFFTLIDCQQTDCPNGEDYSPCTCYQSGIGPFITCDRVPMDEVATIFQNRTTPADLSAVSITPSPTDLNIPANLLGNHRVKNNLYISCDSMDYPLVVDPRAFNPSAVTVDALTIYNCDVGRLIWLLVDGFDQLSVIYVLQVANFGLSIVTLPDLPDLNQLIIEQSTGLNDWVTFPRLVKGLTYLSIYDSQLMDVGARRILNWVLESSRDSLSTLRIERNNLTAIPTQISSFASLTYVNIKDNKEQIPVITANSFSFNKTVPIIDLISVQSCQVVDIEVGAFQGDYSSVRVTLEDNLLTRFEASVFQDIVRQMAASRDGDIFISKNPIDCSDESICHLAWLIRDEPNLLSVVINGQCSNGTFFENLQISGFNNC